MAHEHHVARRSWRGPLLCGLGVLASAAAWAVLVSLAIDFGRAGRTGGVWPWVLLVVATLGAIVCLFLAIMLGTRAATELRRPRSGPRSKGGKRRAAAAPPVQQPPAQRTLEQSEAVRPPRRAVRREHSTSGRG